MRICGGVAPLPPEKSEKNFISFSGKNATPPQISRFKKDGPSETPVCGGVAFIVYKRKPVVVPRVTQRPNRVTERSLVRLNKTSSLFSDLKNRVSVWCLLCWWGTTVDIDNTVFGTIHLTMNVVLW